MNRSRNSAIAVKKKHTRKSLFLSGRRKYIFYVSSLFAGSVHDFEILKRCFDATYEWFKKFTGRVDLGFQGIAQLYRFKKLFLPIRRKRVKKGCCNELSKEEKQINKEQASERVVVEHSIGGMKRYRILSNNIRIKNTGFLDTIIGVCAGLWNFLLIQHNPLINNLH